MKFGVLALDYDGTIAQDGVLAPGIKPAIAEAPARGIVVIIATGRILSDLRSLCGDLSFVDAVVAENGAVSQRSDAHSRSSSAAKLLQRTAAGGSRLQIRPMHCRGR